MFRLFLLLFMLVSFFAQAQDCPDFGNNSKKQKTKTKRVVKNPFAKKNRIKNNPQGDAFITKTNKNKKDKNADAFTKRQQRKEQKQKDSFERKQKRKNKKLGEKSNGEKQKKKLINIKYHHKTRKEKNREKDPLDGKPERKKRKRNRKPQMGLFDKKMY